MNRKLLIAMMCMVIASAAAFAEGTVEHNDGVIMTVRGPISPSAFGQTLTHEHIAGTFMDLNEAPPLNTDRDDAVATMKPLLMELKDRGFTGIVECSTIGLGRDVVILNRLARRTGLHILTNTGGYASFGDAFTVTYVVEDDPNLIAARWIYESEVGIDGTGIKPGFIKIAVDPGP